MILYLSIIGICIVILSLINILANLMTYSILITILIIVGGVLIEFVVDGLFAFLVHLMPNKWFEIDNKFYNVSNGERKFYEKIKIRKWKDKVWELGGLGGFSKKHLESNNNADYLKRFLIESNKGVMTHILGCFVGFVLIPIYLPLSCILSVSLPIAIVNLFLNLPSLFILRYNTPKLLAGYKRLIRTSERAHTNKIEENKTNSKNKTKNMEKTENSNTLSQDKDEKSANNDN